MVAQQIHSQVEAIMGPQEGRVKVDSILSLVEVQGLICQLYSVGSVAQTLILTALSKTIHQHLKY